MTFRPFSTFLALSSVIILISPALAFKSPWSMQGVWAIEKGLIKYRVEHPLHDCDGESPLPTGFIECRDQEKLLICDFNLEIPVKSFVSKDPDKDRDMLAALRAKENPLVSLKGLAKVEGEKLMIDATLSLAGRTKKLSPFEMKLEKNWGHARAQGRFDWSTDDFAIEKPRLIGLPIKDRVSMSIDLHLKRR